MSLGVMVKGPEGIVLAADTRVTLVSQRQGTNPILVNFDNATKLLTFGNSHKWVGAVTYGDALIGTRTAHSFMPEFELSLGPDRLSIGEYADKLSKFFQDHWNAAGMPAKEKSPPGMTFIVGGYNKNEPYGEVFLSNVPRTPNPEPRNPGSFGMTWGGQLEIASRMIHGYDPSLPERIRQELKLDPEGFEKLENVLKSNLQFTIPYEVLPLQDCVDLATFLVRTTMTAQNLAVTVRGVGGSIEVATITRTDGLEWVQKKAIHGEDHHVRT